jgi:hypothetical protein
MPHQRLFNPQQSGRTRAADPATRSGMSTFMKEEQTIMVFRFTVLLPEIADELMEQAAGKCPDTPSGVAEGQPFIDFSREAESLGAAIDSALADITSLGITPKCVQVDEVAATV